MGQYHEIVNLTARTRLRPHAFGSGLKLMEFGHDHAGPMTALMLLLAVEAWAGARIAILGDYGEPNDLTAEVIGATGIDGAAYDSDHITDASSTAHTLLQRRLNATVTAHDWGLCDLRIPRPVPRSGTDVWICNVDRSQHLDPAAFGQPRDLHIAATNGGWGGVTTGLAVLLAAASRDGGRGGGDFYGRSPLVGSWAGDRLVVCPPAHAASSHDLSPQLREALEAAGEATYTIHNGHVTRLDPPWARNLTSPIG